MEIFIIFKKMVLRRTFDCNSILAVVLLTTLLAAPLVHAATITVNVNVDEAITNNGNCTLREAIEAAVSNTAQDGCVAGAGADEIVFDAALAAQTITLTEGEFDITVTEGLTITGPVAGDSGSIIIDADGNSRVFNFVSNSSIVNLNNMTLTGGAVTGFEQGGAIKGVAELNSELYINDSLIRNNNSREGGGVYYGGNGVRVGKFELNTTTISDNTALSRAGGVRIFNLSVLNINASKLIGNAATNGSGGIDAGADVIVVNNTTIANNNALTGIGGGGVFVATSSVDSAINNSTISGNTAEESGAFLVIGLSVVQTTISGNHALDRGGVMYQHDPFGATDIRFDQCTITGNSSVNGAGGLELLFVSSSPINFVNTILAGNTGPEGNIFSTLSFPPPPLNFTNSLFGDDSIEITATGGTNADNQFSDNPDLGPLQDNGGPTFTRLPSLTSPAVNNGNNALVPAVAAGFDQRGTGFQRLLGGTVEIGAVEIETPGELSIVKTITSPAPYVVGQTIEYQIVVSTINGFATNITVKDLPKGLSNIAITAVSGSNEDPGDCAVGDAFPCTIADIAETEIVTFAIAATIN